MGTPYPGQDYPGGHGEESKGGLSGLLLLRYLIKTNVISFITKSKQMTLVFEWLKTKLMKTNILFSFITKTKLMALVLIG